MNLIEGLSLNANEVFFFFLYLCICTIAALNVITKTHALRRSIRCISIARIEHIYVAKNLKREEEEKNISVYSDNFAPQNLHSIKLTN